MPTNQSCLEAYHKFKMGKQFEFVIFKANDKSTEIIVDVHPVIGESEEKWKELGSKCSVVREKDEPVEYWNLRRIILGKTEPRYAVIMIRNPNRNREMMTMLFWYVKYSCVRCEDSHIIDSIATLFLSLISCILWLVDGIPSL